MEIAVKLFFSEFSGKNIQIEMLASINKALIKTGFSLIDSAADSGGNFLILTGGTEKLVCDYITRNQLETTNINLLTHNNNNSLAAALETAALLQQKDISARIILLESSGAQKSLENLLKQEKPLTGQRLGVIGQPSDWLVASSQTKEAVLTSWGLEFIEISIREVYTLMDDYRNQENIEDKLKSIEPVKQQLTNAQTVYKILNELCIRYALDGITIRCFDLVQKRQVTACYALSKLNSQNIPAGCEGDIASITGMMWARHITGKMAWMANPARIDLERGRLVLAHCTAPLNYLKEPLYRSHFETGKSVALGGKLSFTRVTVFRLGGKKLDKLWICEGEFIRALNEETLCRTQGEFSLPAKSLKELISRPLGNHLLILPGWYKKSLLDNYITFFD